MISTPDTRDCVVVLYQPLEREAVSLIEQQGVAAWLPLTPKAGTCLPTGANIRDPFDLFSLRSHQKVLVKQRRLRRQLEKRLEKASLSQAGKTNLVSICLQMAAPMWRLDVLLRGQGPWLVPVDGWKRVDDHQEACALIYPLLRSRKKMAPRIPHLNPLFRMIARTTEGIRARCLRKKKVLPISSIAQGFIVLSSLFLQQRKNNWLLQSPLRGSSKIAFQDLARLWKHSSREKDRFAEMSFAPVEPDYLRTAAEIRTLLKDFKDPLVRQVFSHHADEIVYEISLGESLLPSLTKTLEVSRANTVLFYDICQAERVWLAEAARRAGTERWQFAHMVASDFASTPTLWEAYGRRITMIAASPEASVIFAQSPNAYRLIQRICPKARVRKCRPVIWCPVNELPRKGGDDRERVVLHAGNYDSWSGYMPIIQETSDEYVAGLVSLAQAICQIPHTRLRIRLKSNFKNKAELDRETIASLLPAGDSWYFSEEPSFYSDLTKSDLVVTYSSTVAEEGVHYGYPVLLWGGRMNFHVLPAQTELSAPGRTSAVYARNRSVADDEMIASILANHAGRALSKEEMSPYVWDEELPGREELAKELAG